MFSEWRKRREQRRYEREMREKHGDDFEPIRIGICLPSGSGLKPFEVVAHWRGGPRRLVMRGYARIDNLTDGESYWMYSDLRSERENFRIASEAIKTVPEEHHIPIEKDA